MEVREFCQSGKVGTMFLALMRCKYHFKKEAKFTLTSHYIMVLINVYVKTILLNIGYVSNETNTKMYVCTLEEFILVDIWIHWS